jgi:hypothetical protein
MSYWGYVADALLNEDRDAAERRRRRRARLKQQRERAVLEAAAAALPADVEAPRVRSSEELRLRADQHS